MFGKNKKEQNDVDKYLSKKQRKAIAREEKDRIDRQKALEEVKYREIKGTQEMLPVYDTYQGVIVTRDGHFCKIMEVKPLNFMYLSPQAQNNIISLFSQMLSATPYNMQLISYARKADVDSMIRAVEDLKKNEMNPACFQMQQEYENLLRYRAAQNGVTRRFFVVLEFKADLQNDGTDINKVVGDLNAAASRCRGYLEDAGNQFIPTCETDEGVCDILYQMICRKESETVAYVWSEVSTPIYGQSYASITCDEIGFSSRLYWGDDQSMINTAQGVYEYTGTSQIGYPGCHLLAAHNSSVFSLLQYASVGDIFTVTTEYGRYAYEVDSCRSGNVTADAGTIVASDGTVLVNLGDSDDRLYMYTCYPFGYYGATNQRYVVRATLIPESKTINLSTLSTDDDDYVSINKE